MSRRHRIKDRAERALGVVKAFSVAVPSGVQLKLDVQAASGVADSRDPEQVRLMSAKPYADRLFSYHELGRFPTQQRALHWSPPRETTAWSTRRTRPAGSYSDSAGYPYFLQEYGLELWNYAERSPIGKARRGGRERDRQGLARTELLGPRLQMATDTEQRYLAAMAASGSARPTAQPTSPTASASKTSAEHPAPPRKHSSTRA